MKRINILFGAFLSLAIIACDGSDPTGGFGGGGNDNPNKDPEIDKVFDITDLNGSPLTESLKLTQTPKTNPELFAKDNTFSDEFDGTSYGSNWKAQSYVYETFDFSPSNVKVNGGVLDITLRHDDHTVTYGGSPKQLYFQSGLLRSEKATTYGYYEARIKGAQVFKGSCSAFWLYNVPWMPIEGDDGVKYNNKITYNEIDVIELQQVPKDHHIMSTNYHLMIQKENDSGGFTSQFVRPADMWGENETLAKWDSRDDYHIYACENRPDSIIWYIDNQRVASVVNYYWHLPVNITLSLGLRSPYETYKNGERLPTPTTEAEATAAGFPTTMKVDYVRTYRRKDYSQFKSAKREYR